MKQIELYDTTLRDGCQAEDVAFTNEDKLRIVVRLDDFGIHYIEGGWPGSRTRPPRSSQPWWEHAPGWDWTGDLARLPRRPLGHERR